MNNGDKWKTEDHSLPMRAQLSKVNTHKDTQK